VIASFELYHNDSDGTNTQNTKRHIQGSGTSQEFRGEHDHAIPSLTKGRSRGGQTCRSRDASYREYDKKIAILYDVPFGELWQQSFGDVHDKKAMQNMRPTCICCMIVGSRPPLIPTVTHRLRCSNSRPDPATLYWGILFHAGAVILRVYRTKQHPPVAA